LTVELCCEEPHPESVQVKAARRAASRAGVLTMCLFLDATLAQVLIFVIIIRMILSWFPTFGTLAPVTTAINGATDPLLRPIQRRPPPLGGFDLHR
jgi:uncharacterized protein YggT (Ycf19 family)